MSMSFIDVMIFPLALLMWPVFLPWMGMSYFNDCNEKLDVNVVKILRLDALQCGVLMYSPLLEREIASPSVNCDIFTTCLTDFSDVCKNATILINHPHGESTCFSFVTNRDQESFLDYKSSLHFFVVSWLGMLLSIWAAIMINKQNNYIRPIVVNNNI